VRVSAISEATDNSYPPQLVSLRSAVRAALDYGIAVIEGATDPPVPVELLVRARLSARSGVPLETVLRCYFAGYVVLEQVMWEEIVGDRPPARAYLQRLARVKAVSFERLVAAVSQEYRQELTARPGPSVDRRRIRQIRGLLAGELVEPFEAPYDLDQSHIGLIAEGPGALAALKRLAQEMNRSLLTAIDEGTIWAWLGARGDCNDPPRFEPNAANRWPEGLALAVGEPGNGLTAWRRSHLQAKAVLPLARTSTRGPVRYREVALAATALQNDLLTASLQEMFVLPLEERGDGSALLETLDAYLATDANVSSAAASLSLSRQTVSSRLRAIEAILGHSIGKHRAAIEVALELRHFEAEIRA